MFQGLPMPLAQVKAVNTSESLLNAIRQTIYFFRAAGTFFMVWAE